MIATGWWGGGWGGWDVNVPCTLHQHRCYATGWWEGGWGGWDVNVPCPLHQHRTCWMWRRNREGDACGAMPKLFHWRAAASAQKRLIRRVTTWSWSNLKHSEAAGCMNAMVLHSVPKTPAPLTATWPFCCCCCCCWWCCCSCSVSRVTIWWNVPEISGNHILDLKSGCEPPRPAKAHPRPRHIFEPLAPQKPAKLSGAPKVFLPKHTLGQKPTPQPDLPTLIISYFSLNSPEVSFQITKLYKMTTWKLK